MLIHHKDQVVYEQYFADSNSHTLHDTRSATKTVAALLVGIAIHRGEIDSVHLPVLPFFPDWLPLKNPDRRKAEITLEDFLAMSSKLECNDFNAYSRVNEERMYVMEDWVQFTLDLPIKGYAPWETKPEASAFGRSFAYCTAGAYSLGRIVVRASGTTLPKYTQTHLFDPLGIEKVEWPRTSLGRASTAGGIRLSTRSLMKLGMLYLANGSAGDKRILFEGWVQQSLKTHVNIDDDTEYGYLIWKRNLQIGEKSITIHWMSGNGGNHVAIIPDLDLVIVLTKTAYNQRDAHMTSRRLIDEVVLPVFLSAGM